MDESAIDMASASPSHALLSKELPVLPRFVRLKAAIHNRGRWLVHGWWAWELIAASVSVSAMTALLVLLSQADQKEQKSQQWMVGNTTLTLNTIVAVMSTIIRSSLLLFVSGSLNQNAWNWFAAKKTDTKPLRRPIQDFETFSEAAANSWNSVKLLYRTKGRYNASIGALVVILSIGFDPFVQQVLIVETLSEPLVLSGENLTAQNILPHTLALFSNFSSNGIGNGLGSHIGLTFMEDTKVRSAVLGSIIDSSTSIPNVACPTGNCTWPITPSLSVCSHCNYAEVITSISSKDPIQSNITAQSCESINYSLPIHDHWFYSQPDISSPIITMSTCDQHGYMQTNTSGYSIVYESSNIGDEAIEVIGRNNILLNIYLFGVPFNMRDSQQIDGFMSPFTAYNCTLYMCVRGFSADAVSGKVTYGSPNSQANTTVAILDTSRPELKNRFDDIPSSLNARSAVFEFNQDLLLDLSKPLMDLFNGTIPLTSSHQYGKLEFMGPDEVSESFSGTLVDLDVTATIWMSVSNSLEKTSQMFQRVADSLTTYIRQVNNTEYPDPRYAPTVQVQKQIVRVRWIWLTYSITLQVMGLVFFALTVYGTRRRVVRPWKGHRIPLLLGGIDEGVRGLAKGGLANRTGLDSRIGAIPMRLEFDGVDGIMFRKAMDAED